MSLLDKENSDCINNLFYVKMHPQIELVDYISVIKQTEIDLVEEVREIDYED